MRRSPRSGGAGPAKAGVRLELRRPSFSFGRVDDPVAADLLRSQVAAVDLALDSMRRGVGEFGSLNGSQHRFIVKGCTHPFKAIGCTYAFN